METPLPVMVSKTFLGRSTNRRQVHAAPDFAKEPVINNLTLASADPMV